MKSSSCLVATLLATMAVTACNVTSDASDVSDASDGKADGASDADLRKFTLLWSLRGDAAWVEQDSAGAWLVVKPTEHDVAWSASAPELQTGRSSMAEFVAAWNDPELAKDPPNAGINVRGDTGARAAIVELTSAAYDEATGTLRFGCRCQVGAMDNAWLMSTSSEAPAADVDLLIDPYDAPRELGGIFEPFDQTYECELRWSPITYSWLPGYGDWLVNPNGGNKVLAYGKWDTDTWLAEPFYGLGHVQDDIFGKFGIAQSLSGSFRGCHVWTRIEVDAGYAFEFGLTVDFPAPFSSPPVTSTCQIILPDERRYDAFGLGLCKERFRDTTDGGSVTLEFAQETERYPK